jgi:hypothetical protein
MQNPGIYFVFYNDARSTTNHHLLITPFLARSTFKHDVQVHILLRVYREGLRIESFDKK